jgi:hypothetical protein
MMYGEYEEKFEPGKNPVDTNKYLTDWRMEIFMPIMKLLHVHLDEI